MKHQRITWKARPELERFRVEGVAKVQAGEWTKEEYRREYRKRYYSLPDVMAKQAAGGLLGESMVFAIKETSTAVMKGEIKPRPCAVCGEEKDTKWLVIDPALKPAEHPWFCRLHRSEKTAEQRRHIFEETGTHIVGLLNKMLVAYGIGTVRQLVTYAGMLSTSQMVAMRESQLDIMRRNGERVEMKYGKPVLPTMPPPPAKPAEQGKSGLESLLD